MIKHGSWMTQVTKTFGLLLALVLLLVGAAPVVGQEAAAQAGENPQATVLRPMTEEDEQALRGAQVRRQEGLSFSSSEAIQESNRMDQRSAAAVKTAVRNLPKVGRNEPCPCGSNKKYKKCCGR